jgi:methanogenic corrinoid protein MtbC1
MNDFSAREKGADGNKKIRSPDTDDMVAALIAVDRARAVRIAGESCGHSSPILCLEKLIMPALEEVGRLWESGELSLSQVYMSGRICEEIVDTMLPPKDPQRTYQPKIGIAVIEDHHTLGKRIVASVLRAGGYEITDYGHGISAADLAGMVVRDKVEIMLISALMLPAALSIKDAVSVIREKQPGTVIIVGGAPFSFDEVLWKDVGADAMGRSAIESLELVRRYTGEVKI